MHILPCCFFVMAMSLASYATRTTATTTRVALFKNGYGVFTATVQVPQGATQIDIEALPLPAHGTFWLWYPRTLPLRAARSYTRETIAETPLYSFAQLLVENHGKMVAITDASAERRTYTGRILTSSMPTQPVERPSPLFTQPHHRGYYPIPQPHAPATPSMVMLETEEGIVALPLQSIAHISFPDSTVVTHGTVTHSQPVLALDLSSPAPRAEDVELRYMTPGISWAPSYAFDISDDDTARLSAHAVVINEVEDLTNVTLELVSGFPHTQFSTIPSPLFLRTSLSEFLDALTRSPSQRMESRARITSQVAYMGATYASGADSYGYAAPQEGDFAEDLFFYPVDAFTLARGESVYLPLFTENVPFAHVYTWHVPTIVDHTASFVSRGQDDDRKEEEVWHCGRIRNTLSLPLTTAPASFYRDGRFIGQDTCTYTAVGAENTIRITRAMNIVATQTHIERARERNISLGSWRYDRVTVESTLHVRNRMNTSADMEITADFYGTFTNATPTAEIKTVAGRVGYGHWHVNTRNAALWRLTLPPGEAQDVSYTYDVYIRH